MTQPDAARGTLGGWFSGVRDRVRGTALVVLAVPLLFEAIMELGFGRLNQTAAAAGAGALLLAALVRVRRRDRRSVWRAGVMAGFAAALVASFNAEYSTGISVLFGLAAGFGTVLAYGPAREPVLPEMTLPDLRPAGAAPPPPPAPPADPEAQALAALDNRVTALAAAPLSLPRGRFAESVARIARQAHAMLQEARSDPADFARVRRFLTVYLDQLETLAVRYRNAHPEGGPLAPGLAQVLDDLERAFAEKLAELRAHDIKALDVEVEVLAHRLSEQLAPSAPRPQEMPR
jgi:hypothetical protein